MSFFHTNRTSKHWQLSESLFLVSFLAIVGGYLDAYTYLCRGKVFANAQTGNIALMAIEIAEGKIYQALLYFIPILAFIVGVFMAELIRQKLTTMKNFHWRQLVVMIEIIILIIAGFIPQGDWDILVNIMVSFVCALQVESFRKFEGKPFASTMCTGNLRSGTQALFEGTKTHEKSSFEKAFSYYRIIGFFVIGASIGALLTNYLGAKAIFVCPLILVIVVILMFKEHF